MNVYDKDPDNTLSVVWDFTNDCNAFSTPTTVSTVSFLIQTGIAKSTHSVAAYAVTGVFTGGTGGRVYLVTCRATFANGDTRDRTHAIRCKEL